MACWANKVQACVHTEINLVNTARLLLLKHIRLMLIIEELDYGHPRVTVVDIVAESGSVNNSQAHCRIAVRSRQLRFWG